MTAGKFSEREAAKAMRQMLEAVRYLHSCEPPIVHCDLKPENWGNAVSDFLRADNEKEGPRESKTDASALDLLSFFMVALLSDSEITARVEAELLLQIFFGLEPSGTLQSCSIFGENGNCNSFGETSCSSDWMGNFFHKHCWSGRAGDAMVWSSYWVNESVGYTLKVCQLGRPKWISVSWNKLMHIIHGNGSDTMAFDWKAFEIDLVKDIEKNIVKRVAEEKGIGITCQQVEKLVQYQIVKEKVSELTILAFESGESSTMYHNLLDKLVGML